jgi:crotonobetainyl-CoA:carnitine CoA-transferase CaiB-like acyl-CoA transferase
MQPLDGVTVLDLTRVLAGPYCTMLLGDMGARVIKVEQPGRGDDTREWGPPFFEGESAYFVSVNRNKESIVLDFKKPGGRQILDQLVARSDVLVENFRPGALARVGLDYEALASKHPRLVYCSISGFGQTGPRRGEAGYDAVAQAEGGLMSVTGPVEGPPFRLGVPIADITAGLLAAHGVALALLARTRTGRGQAVDIGLLDSVASLLTYHAAAYLNSGCVPERLGNRHATIAPYETFEASDGDFVLAVGNDEQWKRLCSVVGFDGADVRFATNRLRVVNYGALRPLLAERLRQHTRRHWIDRLKEAGVPCGSVRDLEEVFEDPQLAARDMVIELDHPTIGPLKLAGEPIKLSATPGTIRRPPPTLGQDTNAVLRHDLGLSDDEMAELRQQKVI